MLALSFSSLPSWGPERWSPTVREDACLLPRFLFPGEAFRGGRSGDVSHLPPSLFVAYTCLDAQISKQKGF